MKIIIKINPKKAVGHGVAGGVEDRFDPITPPFWFSKNESSKYRVKPWFFVTFNIIISHIFLENFIEIPLFVQKILRLSLPMFAIFSIFGDIFTFSCHKETNDVSL